MYQWSEPFVIAWGNKCFGFSFDHDCRWPGGPFLDHPAEQNQETILFLTARKLDVVRRHYMLWFFVAKMGASYNTDDDWLNNDDDDDDNNENSSILYAVQFSTWLVLVLIPWHCCSINYCHIIRWPMLESFKPVG